MIGRPAPFARLHGPRSLQLGFGLVCLLALLGIMQFGLSGPDRRLAVSESSGAPQALPAPPDLLRAAIAFASKRGDDRLGLSGFDLDPALLSRGATSLAAPHGGAPLLAAMPAPRSTTRATPPVRAPPVA